MIRRGLRSRFAARAGILQHAQRKVELEIERGIQSSRIDGHEIARVVAIEPQIAIEPQVEIARELQ
jgi:hypothetical protein